MRRHPDRTRPKLSRTGRTGSAAPRLTYRPAPRSDDCAERAVGAERGPLPVVGTWSPSRGRRGERGRGPGVCGRTARTLAEPLLVGSARSAREVSDDIGELLRRVGLTKDAADRYPAQFSGGQRRRIAIARAVARKPKLIICDEPTSALDVTTQAAALSLLSELRDTLGCAYLFITHDLAVVKEFVARALVLRHGRIVEEGRSVDVCERPRHEYTRRLVAAAPVPDPDLQRVRRQQRLGVGAPA
ncbi:ATP-binding cassette domain-containing protein [Streptomyces europaeiscabiei]|uniref:ATP-binding cassette domain-containing protein n=1 Tax=Streptomyces europaeiscabiei TaxID=146819 RepID=UPI000AFD8519|nr:ABC transporter ATP-binding protein [Streptomyces europaeiscabiei]MDX2770550.1 ABC transporter ATP-binding protein [Streptomyces europaeiscabiei]MDX3665800.1 ABC transporter ATP-binding protein [Streptomyces europaeiscabiei]MDX3778911.1 ABC transporter ATP-binding protein [Streptomyces europaeiscabiei]